MGYDYMHELDELVKTMKRTHSHFMDSITTTPSSASADTLVESYDSKAAKSSKSDFTEEKAATNHISDVAVSREEKKAAPPREKDEIELQAEKLADQYLQKYIQNYGNPFAHVAARLAASPNYNFEMQRLQQLRSQVQQQQMQQQRFQQQQGFMPQQQFHPPPPQMLHGHMPYYWPCQHHCVPAQNYPMPMSAMNPPAVNTETIERSPAATVEAAEVVKEEVEIDTTVGQDAETDDEEFEQADDTGDEEDAESCEEVGNGSSSYQLDEEEGLSDGADTADFDSEEEIEKPKEKVLCDACSAPLKSANVGGVSPDAAQEVQPEGEQYSRPAVPPADASVPPKIVSISYNDTSYASYYADLLDHVIKALPYLNLDQTGYTDWATQVNYQVQTYY